MLYFEPTLGNITDGKIEADIEENWYYRKI